MKKIFRKKIAITGGRGTLGSYFYNKYKKKYNIIRYPYRLENFKLMNLWLKNNSFDYFIHFAAVITKNNKNYKNINLINTKCSIELLKNLFRIKNSKLKYFLYISTAHVYGFSKKKFTEKSIRKPNTRYGKTKKIVEDFILSNKNKDLFKVGVARIFNYTFKNQKIGHFIPDLYEKIRLNKIIPNINTHRDFIHIDDIARALELMLRKKANYPINVCSGKKVNLIKLAKKLNNLTFKKNITFNTRKLKNNFNICGKNRLLNSLGIKKFKNTDSILKSFLNENK